MKNLQKTFFILVILTTILWGAGSVFNPEPAHAITPGDLIKAPNSTAVYYVGVDNKKYVFPNGTTYLTWYPDFSTVQTVTAETLQSYETTGNVVARAGTKLIQFVTINPDGTMYVDDPKVYALEPNGVKRWITTAYLAQQLYGYNWETKIYGCPNYLIDNYPLGVDITNSVYPEGSLVKQSGNVDIYYINSESQKQLVTTSGFTANLFQNQYVITTSLCLTCYSTGTTISGNVPEITTLAGGTSINQPNNNYYVATNGNDNNAGTLISPYRTISKAATVAQAGDIIYIRGGTYDESVTPPNSGTENNYITFTAYPGETVTVRGMTGYVFYIDGVDYIKIDGLKIMRGLGVTVVALPAYKPYKGTMAHGAGIKLFGADYNIITNNEIYDNDIGIYLSEGGPDINNVTPSAYNQIINNVVHHNGEAGMRIKRSDYTIIDSNQTYNNGLTTNNVFSEYSPGIIYYCTINATITNNISYGNATHAIVNYAGTNEETCDASGTYMKNNIFSQTNPFPISGKIYGNNKVVFSVAFKEATDTSHIYRQNTFYNGSPGSLMIGWGVNNAALIGQVVTFSNFNSLANALNSDSGVGNIEATTNPI